MNKLIAIAGTNGSGKDTVGTIIAKEHGYLFFSVTDLLRDECRRRNISTARENTRMISEEWRKKYGPGILVEKAVEHYQTVKENYKGLVLASIRNVGEADKVHELAGVMVWIDADPHVRYDRLQANRHSRSDRGPDDDISFEQFLKDEEAENYSNGDPNKLGKLEVKAKCDVFIDNDSDTNSLIAKINSSLFNAGTV